MKYISNICFSILFCCTLFPFRAYSQANILIDSTNAPEETSIAFSAVNPANMVAGANIILNYYSHDTGRTWKGGMMKSPYGVWGDPIVISDTAGNFYFFHLSTPSNGHWLDRMVCQKSNDGGKSWSSGTYTGLNGEKNQDKPGIAIDLTKSKYRNRIYLAWTQFDLYHSHAPQDSSRILFSYSSDGAATWSKPQRIDSHAGDCLDGDNTDEGAIPCVGPTGQVYMAWAGPQGLVFNKSIDGGITWMPKEKKITPIIGGWDYEIHGIDRCDGLPITCCDVSNSPYRGTIYVNWSDQRNGTDNANVWLVKSSDGGNNWSKPIRINSDGCRMQARQHFMSWLSVDRFTGYLYTLFYDRRNHEGDTTDVYLAVSKDGGNSFVNFRINDNSFVPTAEDFFGDYICVQSFNNIVRPLWMQLNNHKLSIWTVLLNANDLGWALHQSEEALPAAATQTPYSDIKENESLWFTWQQHNDASASMSIVDVFGKTVCNLFNHKLLTAGEQEYILNLAEHPLPPGVYCYQLQSHEGFRYKRFVVY